MHPVEIWIPLIVGIGAIAVSVLFLGTAAVASLHFLRRERRRGIVMSPAWKFLGPLEAADGLLMFGITTAMLFELIRRLTETRFPDLRG